MGLRGKDQAGGYSAGIVIGVIFGAIGALALVWLLAAGRTMGAG